LLNIYIGGCVKGRYIDIPSIPRLRAGEAHIRSVLFPPPFSPFVITGIQI